ncbi:MAG: DUF5693 family protein, partial [Pyramidobacter sp.]|nr:DUF5693 family protein [Pyramidobacter sp.]
NYLMRRFPDGECFGFEGVRYFRLPLPFHAIAASGVLPDVKALGYLASLGVPVVYAVSPCAGGTAESLTESLAFLCARYGNIKAICPIGDVTAAYPRLREMGDFVREWGLLLTQTEFSVQYGAQQQNWYAWPNIVSLHSVRDEEVLKRRITRPVMLNRLYRAAAERSVRLLVLRQDPLRSIPASLEEYCADVRALRQRLDAAGFGRLWPTAAPQRSFSPAAVVGLALLLLTLLLRYAARFFNTSLFENRRFLMALGASSLVLGLAALKISFVLRCVGALTACMLATEAALHAMDRWKVPLRGVLEVLILVMMGGCVVAGSFSSPLYMHRMIAFSGVKLSLLLPLVLVLVMDFRRKEHPESVADILKRPPLWGELVVLGGLFLAGLIVLLRSGNYGFVSSAEIQFRDWIEHVLVARPRTKEFLVGYPSLVLWYYLKRHGLWSHWREILRLASVLGFSSAVNTFCHFHTPLYLSLLRILNGWWSGLLLGVLLLTGGVLISKPLGRFLGSDTR